MTGPALRAALRIARRDALRHRWRSLLVVALIGLPVFAVGCADIAYRTWQLDPAERVGREIGTADAAIRVSCAGVNQLPQAWFANALACPANVGSAPQPTQSALLAHLPSGTRAIDQVSAGVRIRTAAGVKYADEVGLDYADPLARGTVIQLQGRAPRTTGETALTEALAHSTGLKVGDTMRTAGPDRAVTVVGIVRDARYRKIETAYVLPAAVDHSQPDQLSTTWLVDTPGPVSWADVLGLNRTGYLVLSRSVYLNPPPRSEVPFPPGRTGGTAVVAALTLVVGMALLEVVLLAGPAFAVSARRQRHDLALVAATGGRPSDLRNVVLANGVVLGAAAGIAATAGAVLLTAVGIPTLGPLIDQIPGHFDARPGELAAVASVSLVTALLAAMLPAVHAARTDVVAALAGRRGTVRTRGRVPIAGAAVAGLGIVIAIFGALAGTTATSILLGVALTELGLIACTPTIIGAAARLGGRLPVAPRIALRDAGRNRSAATPAVAAVMASMIGAVAILIGVTSTQDRDRRTYQPMLPDQAVLVRLSQPGTGGAAPAAARVAAIVDSLRRNLPVEALAVVRAPYDGCADASGPVCESTFVNLVTTDRSAARYRGGGWPFVLVDDGSGVAALFGRPEPAAAAALRAGHAVVPDATAVQNGTVTIQFTSTRGGKDEPLTSANSLQLPATIVTDGFAPAGVILPPSAVTRLGVPSAVGVTATTTRPPTDRELQAARGAVQQIDPTLRLDIETGFHDSSAGALYALVGVAALIALGAASIATALANADGRDDLVTLAAVGAAPRTRRLISLSRAGVIAGLGCLIGVAAGFVPAYAWQRAVHSSGPNGGGLDLSMHFVVPWPPILLALVGVPLVTSAIAGLATRSRLPSERAGS
ncbi:MAG: putative transport system permease protein [Pseudonocardiales bacterium]|nr:putative transport system permease protein [Pseudonocardiales bacterium]